MVSISPVRRHESLVPNRRCQIGRGRSDRGIAVEPLNGDRRCLGQPSRCSGIRRSGSRGDPPRGDGSRLKGPLISRGIAVTATTFPAFSSQRRSP